MREVKDITETELDRIRNGQCGVIEATTEEIGAYLGGKASTDNVEVVSNVLDTARHNVHHHEREYELIVIRIVRAGSVEKPEHTNLEGNKGDE